MPEHRLFNRLLPNPGSFKAYRLGCTCNMLMNQLGYGSDSSGLTQNWLIDDSCVMHNELSHQLDDHQAQKEQLRFNDS